MAKLANLARMTTATTGTGTITLGSAKAGYLSFASAGVSDGDVVAYGITDGANSEIGYGTYTLSGTTLTRNVRRSTNSNAAISLSGSAEVFISPSAEDLVSGGTPQGRLTLTTATPVLTTTVSAATTVYYTPYVGRLVPLYDGSSFTMVDIGGELSQATTDSTKSPAACTTNSNYDVFVWNDSGTYRATRGPAWSSATARGTGAGTTELERVRGIWLNKVDITNGPAANRGTYVGTIRTNSSSQVPFIYGALAAGGTAAVLGVWNAYNRIMVQTTVQDSGDSWTYGSSTFRQANNSTGMQVSFVSGLEEDAFDATYAGIGTASASGACICGVGYDSVTAKSGTSGFVPATFTAALPGRYGVTALGFHYVAGIEVSLAGTATFYGDSGFPTSLQSGLWFRFPM